MSEKITAKRIIRSLKYRLSPGRYAPRRRGLDAPPNRALQWILDNRLPGGGIRVQSGHPNGYPEVTGYIIPTLLDYGETDLAVELVHWLLSIQKPDGAFPDPDQGNSYVFDTGQALRGLLAGGAFVPEANDAARRACDFLCDEMVDGGAGGFVQRYSGLFWTETAQLYVLPPLFEAGDMYGDGSYREAAARCLAYYQKHDDYIRPDGMTHFLAYELEALIDMGQNADAQKVLDQLEALQKPDGSIRGVGGVRWVCVPGLAQLALCWYKLGQWEPADRAMAWVDAHQQATGGFRGSHGFRARYKRSVDVSWAPKFYLDAHRLRVAQFFNRQTDDFPDTISPDDGRVQAILDCIKSGDSVAEIGCGKGRFLKAIESLRQGVSLTGVDPAARMTKELPEGIEGRLGTLESIPLPNDSFDVVFTVEAIEHTANPKRAVAELVRITKPGGQVLIIDKQLAHWGRLQCPSWEHWPEIHQLADLLRTTCDDVKSEPVAFDEHSAEDGLMVVWKGRKR